MSIMLVFSHYLITIMWHSVHIKIASYRTFATAIWQDKVSSNVTEDLMIKFLQSNLIWQVSCASSNANAHTEISSWSIYDIEC